MSERVQYLCVSIVSIAKSSF